MKEQPGQDDYVIPLIGLLGAQLGVGGMTSGQKYKHSRGRNVLVTKEATYLSLLVRFNIFMFF